ncbi:15226_t:CDS:2 [Rhizophagus irregularis]|nr:15226_t:CDS:2 [Rhizophagus irregularis]
MSLPSVDDIKKGWKRDDIITFLQIEGLNLDLDKEDIGIIRNKKVSGKDFLSLTTEKLENYGLQPGPASRIAELVKEINGEQDIYFQYYDSIVIPESYNSWTNFRELFSHFGTVFGLEGFIINYVFVIGKKKVDLTSKKDFIELVKQNRISVRNSVKILDVNGYGSHTEL